MTKGFFLIAAFVSIVYGAEMLCVEEIEWRTGQPMSAQSFMGSFSGKKKWEPPEWAPWSCLSGGATLFLWTMMLFSGASKPAAAKH